MRGAGHVARIGRGSCVLGCDRKERDDVEDLGVDGRIMLNTSSRSGLGAWTGLIWLRIETDGGLLWIG